MQLFYERVLYLNPEKTFHRKSKCSVNNHPLKISMLSVLFNPWKLKVVKGLDGLALSLVWIHDGKFKNHFLTLMTSYKASMHCTNMKIFKYKKCQNQ